LRADDGTRTHDLLHGKRVVGSGLRGIYKRAGGTVEAVRRVAVDSSFANREDVPAELRKEWDEERKAAVALAVEACEILKRRELRIALLFERHSLVHRSAMLAYMALSTIATGTRPIPGQGSATDMENEREASSNQWRDADKSLDEFSRRAREAKRLARRAVK
jgi:hypothetical protein